MSLDITTYALAKKYTDKTVETNSGVSTKIESGEGIGSVQQVNNIASGKQSFAEGYNTTANIDYSHTEGYNTETLTKAYKISSVNGAIVTLENGSNLLNDFTSDGIIIKDNEGNPELDDEGNYKINKLTLQVSFLHYDTESAKSYKYLGRILTIDSDTQFTLNANDAQTKSLIGDPVFTTGLYVIINGGAFGNEEYPIHSAIMVSSHAEGINTKSYINGHAEGVNTEARGYASHSEGRHTIAHGEYSHAEGYYSEAKENVSHAEGSQTQALGASSHAEGFKTIVYGEHSHAEGVRAVAGSNTKVITGAHAEGIDTVASGNYSHAEGEGAVASAQGSHTEGHNTTAMAKYAHAEGSGSTAQGEAAHAEGITNKASGMAAHAEGNNTEATEIYAHSEGYLTKAQGEASHAEGKNTYAIGRESHSEGNGTRANKDYSHAEGYQSQANNTSAHAEGTASYANGEHSHAEGYKTYAKGNSSHSEGSQTIAGSNFQHVQGKFNIEDTENKYAHIVGDGTSNDNRKNIHTLNWNGNAWFKGDVLVGGTNQDDAKKLITEDELNNLTTKEEVEPLGALISERVDLTTCTTSYSDTGGTVGKDILYGNHQNIQMGEFLYPSDTRVDINISGYVKIKAHIENTSGWTKFSVNDEDYYISGTNKTIEIETNVLKPIIVTGPHGTDIYFDEFYKLKAKGLQNSNIQNGEGEGSLIQNPSAQSELMYRDGSDTEYFLRPLIENNTIKGNLNADLSTDPDWSEPGISVTPGSFGKNSITLGGSNATYGQNSITSGTSNITIGDYANASNAFNIAYGKYSHAEGYNTIAYSKYSHVQGRYNNIDTENKYAHIVGNGDTTYGTRSNAYTLDWNGNGYFAGDVTFTVNGTQYTLSSLLDRIATLEEQLNNQ